MNKSTEWVNKKKLKCNDIIENYKNIEMFQNIYNHVESVESNDGPIIEGAKFNIFDELNMHKKRKNTFKIPQFAGLTAGFNAIKDFILCPFYKSDEIIDKGIQSLLSVFLAVGCNDLSLNLFQKNGDTEILDLNDLIDPNLLYTEEFTPPDNSNNDRIDSSRNLPNSNVREDFVSGGNENMREGLTAKKKVSKESSKTYNKSKQNANTFASKFKMDCHAQKETARQNIKKYSSKIRVEIYNILFIPLIIHILYNLYYMFFFKNRQPFIDVEKDYYNPYLKENFNYILGIAVKPLTWFLWVLNGISNWKFLHEYSDKYPYVFYIGLYIFVYSIITNYGKNILALTRDLLFGLYNPFSFFIGFIMALEFFIDMVKETIKSALQKTYSEPISGTIKWLIYYIVRLIINIFLFPFAAYSVIFYLCTYFFFAIHISDKKDTFEVYSDIDDSIYDAIYKMYNPDCDSFGLFKYVLQFISKYSFMYLIEITIFIVLCNGLKHYSSIDNVNVQSFLYILSFTMMFILGIWCFTKYFTVVKQMDEKYDIFNAALKT
jgi:hypothetical protein